MFSKIEDKDNDTLLTGANLVLVPTMHTGTWRLVMPGESGEPIHFQDYHGKDAYALKWPVFPWFTGPKAICGMIVQAVQSSETLREQIKAVIY